VPEMTAAGVKEPCSGRPATAGAAPPSLPPADRRAGGDRLGMRGKRALAGPPATSSAANDRGKAEAGDRCPIPLPGTTVDAHVSATVRPKPVVCSAKAEIPAAGLEPATNGLEGRRSIQLSYAGGSSEYGAPISGEARIGFGGR
jgi:hypothetical protein